MHVGMHMCAWVCVYVHVGGAHVCLCTCVGACTHVGMCIQVCGCMHTCVAMCMHVCGSKGNLQESVLAFHHMHAGDYMWVIKPGSKPLTH